jgi:bacterioferritin
MDKSKSIELLNRAVADELLAIHQYMYFHFHLDDQGLKPLAAKFRQIAIAEMLHAERFAERILFLKGEVEMVVGGKGDAVEKIQEPADMLKRAADLEERASQLYNDFARQCSEHSDAGTKEVFEAILAEEEQHFDEFDTVMEHIQRFGPSYLALQSFSDTSSADQA